MSKGTPSELAREILRLEAKGEGRWDPEYAQRWLHLANELLHKLRVDGEKRRNLRLPCQLAFEALIDGQRVPVTVTDVSHSGVSAEVSAELGVKEGAAIALQPRQAQSPVLPCRVVKVQSAGARRRLGLQFESIDPARHQQYFDQTYYPAYVTYLNGLAQLAYA